MLAISQTLDRFATDFHRFLSKSFHNDSRNWNVKVVIVNNETWASLVPEHLREQFRQSDGNEGCRDFMIVYDRNRERIQVPVKDRRLGMRVCGFKKEQIDSLSQYDILLFVSSDYDISIPVQLAHLLIHIQEALSNREIFHEQESNTHDFCDSATLELLLRFVADVGEEEFSRRYRLTNT